MLATTFANGRLWAALDTGVRVRGDRKAGVEWFIIRPGSNGASGSVLLRQGYLAIPGQNAIYPAIAATPRGAGAMSFTLAGQNWFPSQGYASFDVGSGLGPWTVAAAGTAPQDGFSEYRAFGDPPRPRWGDYGMAYTDDGKLWMANEYIGAEACSLLRYENTGGTCGNTRTALANWGTRITLLNP